jgi:hypothetical protein
VQLHSGLELGKLRKREPWHGHEGFGPDPEFPMGRM